MSNTELTLESFAALLKRQQQSINGLRWLALALIVLLLTYTELRRSFSPGTGNTIQAGTVTSDTVNAGTIFLRNPMGDIVAMLSSSADGSPSISLFDQKKVRLSISLGSSGGPSVSLLDPDGGVRAVLSLNGRQEPSLSMYNAAKVPRALLAIDTSGSGWLAISGAAGGLNLSGLNGRARWNSVGGTAQDLPVQK